MPPHGDAFVLSRALAMQAVLFGAIGLGTLALRRMTSTPSHPRVARRTELLQYAPALAAAASELALVDEEGGRVEALLDDLVRLVHLDRQGGPAAQWRMARLSTKLVRDAEAMCRAAPIARSERVFRAAMACRSETVPKLRGLLDDLLHNHLLAR
jgi:hypothetical protein